MDKVRKFLDALQEIEAPTDGIKEDIYIELAEVFEEEVMNLKLLYPKAQEKALLTLKAELAEQSKFNGGVIYNFFSQQKVPALAFTVLVLTVFIFLLPIRSNVSFNISDHANLKLDTLSEKNITLVSKGKLYQPLSPNDVLIVSDFLAKNKISHRFEQERNTWRLSYLLSNIHKDVLQGSPLEKNGFPMAVGNVYEIEFQVSQEE